MVMGEPFTKLEFPVTKVLFADDDAICTGTSISLLCFWLRLLRYSMRRGIVYVPGLTVLDASKLTVKEVGESTPTVPMKVELVPRTDMPLTPEVEIESAEAEVVPEFSSVPVTENIPPCVGAAGSRAS